MRNAFCWWAGVDSNHRRHCRQIYSLLHLAALEPTRICSLVTIWSWLSESNQQPADYKSAALPVELSQHFVCGALGRNRTTDTGIFSPLLYHLSYQGKKWRSGRESNPRPLA